jgi:hypothetical protein
VPEKSNQKADAQDANYKSCYSEVEDRKPTSIHRVVLAVVPTVELHIGGVIPRAHFVSPCSIYAKYDARANGPLMTWQGGPALETGRNMTPGLSFGGLEGENTADVGVGCRRAGFGACSLMMLQTRKEGRWSDLT